MPALLPATAIVSYCFYLELKQPVGPFYALIGIGLGAVALLVSSASVLAVQQDEVA